MRRPAQLRSPRCATLSAAGASRRQERSKTEGSHDQSSRRSGRAVVKPLFEFRNYGLQLPHHWSTISNGAAFGMRHATPPTEGFFFNAQASTSPLLRLRCGFSVFELRASFQFFFAVRWAAHLFRPRYRLTIAKGKSSTLIEKVA